MDIRKFKLTNSKGSEYDLNNLNWFFTDVRGLGFENDFEFESVGGFFLLISKNIKQLTPKGTIIFSDYKWYRSFINFLEYPSFTLQYEVPIVVTGLSDAIYMSVNLDVEIKSFKKGELENGALSCDIEFISIGTYYTEENSYIYKDNETSEFPYTFPFTFRDTASGTAVIDSSSNIDSPCTISIFGPCINPSWSHYVNGVETTNGKVNCSVDSGERLIIDCKNIPYSIKKYDNFLNEIDDCYQDSDFSTGRFVYVKNGRNEISFTHEGSEELYVVISTKFNSLGI